MAITQLQATGNTASGATSVAKAFVSNVTAGSLLVCAVTVYDATKTPTVSDTVNGAWTQALSYSNTSVLNAVTRIFYYPNSAGGACTVTASWSGSASGEIHQAEYAGAATSSPLDQTGTGAASSGTTATTGSLTPSVPGELLWGWCGFLNTGSVGSGYTQVNNSNGNLSEYQVQTTAATTQVSWGTTGGYVCVAAAFKPAAASVPHFLLLFGVGS